MKYEQGSFTLSAANPRTAEINWDRAFLSPALFQAKYGEGGISMTNETLDSGTQASVMELVHGTAMGYFNDPFHPESYPASTAPAVARPASDLDEFIYLKVQECCPPPMVVSDTAVRQLRPVFRELWAARDEIRFLKETQAAKFNCEI